MSIKAALLVAAGVLVALPQLAMAKSHHGSSGGSSDPIVNHTGGPISYAELQQMHTTGYNARSGRRHKSSASSVAPEAGAGAPTTTGADAAPQPQPVNPPAPSAGPATPAPDAGPAAPPAPGPDATPSVNPPNPPPPQ